MAFEIIKQKFGELTEYVLQESATGNRCVIVPELGGIVRQLSLRKELTLFSVIKTPATPQSLLEDTKSASGLLFPFASRIPEGRYTFLGKSYQLGRNESGGRNAIHGLLKNKKFELEEQTVYSDHASIKLSFHLDHVEGYPFQVKFSVTYQLHADGRFMLTYEALNTGQETCPVMFGWHPYFMLGNEDTDAWKIEIPSEQIVTFDDNMIPTGVAPFNQPSSTLLHKNELDNCFKLNDANGRVGATKLISENQHVTLVVEQETGTGKFNHLVLYTPPSRNCVAIEPLTANVNAFNNGEGLNIVAKGESVTGTITVRLT
jgi:aldose 1-epimerase